MATTLSRSDTDTTFSDCSITFLLPRTLGSSLSAGAPSFDSDDLGYVSSLFSSTALNNSTKLLEHAKMIRNSNRSSNPNASLGDGNNISVKRSHGDQIESPDKRARQRRPGLPGVERREHVFNFSVKATSVEDCSMGTSEDFSKRSHCVKSNSQSWPAIDYSCLEHISDPIEYFSTYRKLENAEKELRKLKGEASPKLRQPLGRRNRQRRPGLLDNEGKKNVFKFPGMTDTVEDSQIENSTQSNGLSITELTIASCSKEISQIKNSQAVEPESKLTGNAETCDKGIDELERLLSKCRKLDSDGISNLVRETLQINPIHVEKSRGLPFSAATENKFESPQLSQISPVPNKNKIDGLSNLKGRFSLIIRPGDPFFRHKSVQDMQSNGPAEPDYDCNVSCDAGIEKLLSSERGMQKEDLEKLKSDCNEISVDRIAELEKETLKARLLDAEMTNSVDHLSALKRPIPMIDIQGRLAKISTLKRNIMQNSTEGELLMFSRDLEESSFSKSREMHSSSPADVGHLDGGFMDAQNASIPGLSNLQRSMFEDTMHSPSTEASEEDLDKRKTLDPIGRQFTLLEDTYQRQNGTISVEFTSIVSRASFEEAGEPSASVDHRLSVNTNVPEQILHAEAPEDDSLPENPAFIDEQLEGPCEVLNGRSKNQGHSETSGGSSNRKLVREEPPPRRRKQNSILRRKSLAGAGTVWESGVRRSTRIRVKPLQYWCGERFLYGRVHDSLTTVIGVKKYGTPPQKGREAIMKVQSFVSEDYADLVAQAALY